MAMNVLLVDDSAVMRSLVLKTLQMSGMPLGDVHQAGSGLDALRVLRENRVDLMLLDISMPGMRGDELLAQIRTEPTLAELRVVVVSSERSAERIAQVHALGAVFINKPFSPERLRAVLTSIRVPGHELATR